MLGNDIELECEAEREPSCSESSARAELGAEGCWEDRSASNCICCSRIINSMRLTCASCSCSSSLWMSPSEGAREWWLGSPVATVGRPARVAGDMEV